MKFISIEEAINKKKGNVAVRGWILAKANNKEEIKKLMLTNLACGLNNRLE
jgi:hypothetical protein